MTMVRPTDGAALLLAAAALGASSAAAADGALFPTPFVVEHGVVQTDPDGGSFATDPVTDYYSGSWIVSVRPDGSRLVVDFARRELTEIRPDRSTYSVLSFSRFAELKARLARAEQAPGGAPAAAAQPGSGDPPEPELAVTDVPVREGVNAKSGGDSVLARPGVRRLRVSVKGAPAEAPLLDVWLDPQVRLSPPALAALEGFEREVVGGGSGGRQALLSRSLAAARTQAGGALAVRTSRPLKAAGSGSAAGAMEDIASRVELLASFPNDLVAVPEGYQRSAHPLELMVSFAEEEAQRNAQALAATAKP